MTEDQIERIVEGKFDRLDSRYMKGIVTKPDYESAAIAIDQWAKRQYAARRGARLVAV